MYDSYNDYYGLNDVEAPQVRMVGDFSNPENTNPIPKRKKSSMTRDEYAEFVIQKSKFMETLNNEIDRYNKVIATIDKRDIDIINAYKHKRGKVEQLATATINDFDDLELYKWMYNGGNIRDKKEETQARQYMDYQKQYQEDMDFRNTAEYYTQKTLFVILMFLVIFILPGWLLPTEASILGFHVGATFTNLLVLFFLHPLQLFLFGLACCSDGFVKLETKNDGGAGVKGAAVAAGVSAAMQARNMSKMGKDLMSGGKKI